ncbi:MAG: TRZ/ATZ family hydrolase [Pseudomonadota bacterium]
MQACDTLIKAGWIAPVEPESTLIEDGAIAIAAGRIVAVGHARELTKLWSPSRTVDRPAHLMIPGLINAHTHAAMSLLRGVAEDMPLERWLQEGVWPMEAEHVGPEMVRDGNRLAMLEMVRGGITCFNDMYFFPDVAAEVASAARIRASLGLPVIDFPTAWASNADEYIAKGQAVRDSVVSNPLISTQIAPHSTYTVSLEALTRIRTLADQLDMPIHIHLQETQVEVDQGVALHGKRPVEYLDEIGIVNSNLLAAHMVAATREDLVRFASNHASIVHCPSSNLKLASGFAPVAEMLSMGINVAIGTDGAASNNALDMIAETRLAGLVAKGRENDATVLPAATLLRMATLNGARALGLEDQTGSLVVGKWADVTCVNLDAAHCVPIHDPVATLFYAANRNDVSDVWVAGVPVLEKRQHTTLDAERILARTAEWSQKLSTPDNK